jgi:hypothetical protein
MINQIATELRTEATLGQRHPDAVVIP